MLEMAKSYEEAYNSFRWNIPEYFNIAIAICDRWADGSGRLALIHEDKDGSVQHYTFDDLKMHSNRLANALEAYGITTGDRVAIIMDQSPETAISHIATHKLGAIAVPMLSLLGPDALAYRLGHCEAKVVITDADCVERILSIRSELPTLHLLVVVNSRGNQIQEFWSLLDRASSTFSPRQTKAVTPAYIMYTSGTTGDPKAALHGHQLLLGHIPGFQFIHNFFPQQGDLVWSPADWAWMAGLGTVFLPTLFFGVPLVAYRMKKFDPELVFHFLSKHGVRNSFMPPAALNMMRLVNNPSNHWDLKLRTLVSGGQALGEEVFDWARSVTGVSVNEIYGQTEAHLATGKCSAIMDIRPGSVGRPTPGRTVELLDARGNPVAAGEIGEAAVRRPDPIVFLEYYKDPGATAKKLRGDWCMTGDMLRKDADGYFWFAGRDDDMIKSAGYRIGPDEVEGCLRKHPAVHMAGVIGSPDPVRGSIVKAYIHLKRGVNAQDPALKQSIQDFVKTRLAAYEYPREIEFVDQLPLGLTGKVLRKELKKRNLEQKK